MSSASQAGRDPRVGTTVAGKYRVERLLGAGGMGAVYEALNTWTERRVALKLLHAELGRDAEVSGRFLREARVATKVAHPNIVEVLDMGQDPADGALYLVQEFLEGGDLRALLDKRGRLELREAYGVLVPVMSALVAAQSKGVVHRDLKPENIFLVQSGGGPVTPKLIDFGIAKLSGEGLEKGLTKTGAAMGTPYYMSPEQAKGAKDVDAQTDVWALGVLWFEALTGRCPFEGDSYNELLAKILTEAAPAVASVNARVPAGLAAAVDRALVRDRAQRWKSAREFLAAVLGAGELQGEAWLRALRSGYEPQGGEQGTASGAYGATREALDGVQSVASGAASEGAAGAGGGVVSATTLGRTAREVSKGEAGSGRTGVWVAGGVAGVLAVIAGVGFAVNAMRKPAEPEVRVLSVGSASARESVSAARAGASASATAETPRYAVRVTASPASAAMELDGVAVAGNVLVREFERDGAEHVLRVSADGYEARAVSFRDVAPPEEIALAPRAAAPAQRGGAGAVRAAARPSAVVSARPSAVVSAPVATAEPRATAQDEHSGESEATARPRRPVINGAPVLGM